MIGFSIKNMTIGLKKNRNSERGFTIIETLIVVGLSTLITVGIIMGLLEGLDTLHEITDTQSTEFGHQRAMNVFLSDVQSARWFYNGEVHDEGGGTVLNETAPANLLIMGWEGPDGDEIWVRYKIRSARILYISGTRILEQYLVRTVVSASGDEEGSTIVATGLENLLFSYEMEDGTFTDRLPEIHRIGMALRINVGGASVNREYVATMRNTNGGVREPPADFGEVEFFLK